MIVVPKILDIDVGTDPIDEWAPEYTRSFSTQIVIALRFEKEDVNLFYLDVSTPDIFDGIESPRFIDKLLIVEKYDKEEIVKFINKVLFEKQFENIEKFYDYIRKYFRWEFDNYYIPPK